MRRWSEPVDLPLLLSQTKYNWSLAADDVDDDSARHEMVAECGDGSQLKLDLLSTHTRTPMFTELDTIWCPNDVKSSNMQLTDYVFSESALTSKIGCIICFMSFSRQFLRLGILGCCLGERVDSIITLVISFTFTLLSFYYLIYLCS
jgi:hypothetical protein